MASRHWIIFIGEGYLGEATRPDLIFIDINMPAMDGKRSAGKYTG